jgi:hypothetical protein
VLVQRPLDGRLFTFWLEIWIFSDENKGVTGLLIPQRATGAPDLSESVVSCYALECDDGQMAAAAQEFNPSSSRTPGWPLTRTWGLAHGGHAARGSKRRARQAGRRLK